MSGGTSGYSYTWSDGSHTPNNNGLANGTYSVTVTDAHGCTVSGAFTVTGCSARSSNEANPTESAPVSVMIYPNPTEGTFAVVIPDEVKEAAIQICDVTGKTLFSRDIADNTGEPVYFSLSGVAPGMYIVKVNAGRLSTVVKLVKK